MKLYYKESKGKNPQLEALYQKAFPFHERIPYEDLDILPGGHLFGVYKDSNYTEFAGLIDILDYKGVCQVRYLATEENCRGQGIGSLILDWVKETWKDSIIAIDVESDHVPCPNLEQRKRRKDFYHRNGFQDSEDSYRWNGDVFDILCAHGKMEKGQYVALWKELFVLLKEREDAKKKA